MTEATVRHPLVRPRTVVIGGVAAALAVHLRWPVALVRIAFVCLVFAGAMGPLLYLWLWALVPLDTDAAPVTRRVPGAAILLGVAAVADVLVLTWIANPSDSAVNVSVLTAMAAAGGAVGWSLGLDRGDPERSVRYAYVVRLGSVAALLIAGIAVLLSRPSALNAVLGLVAIVLGAGVLVAPRMVTLWTDLLAERSARVRDEQRAEIAAHLHDSVLQTLALIQNRAGASSEVARIARAQERELRDWLFADDLPPAADLATELRAIAANIELDYPVRIDVVAAGTSAAGTADASLVGAAREAMLNAARHAGGDVSVYVETPPGAVDVYVRDRGPGVDLNDLPDDRLGIRESIIGRMTRAGGTATVRSGSSAAGSPSAVSSSGASGPGASGSGASGSGQAAGTGTEVHLHLEVARD